MTSWQSFFFDKFANGQFKISNPATRSVTVESLSHKENMLILRGKEAQVLFVLYAKAKGQSGLIPTDLEQRLYRTTIYVNNDFGGSVEGIKEMYTLISINTLLFEKIVIESKPIPNYLFFKSLMITHLDYDKALKGLKVGIVGDEVLEKAKKNFEMIKERTHVTANYHHDPAIENPTFLEKKIKLYLYQKCTIQWMIDLEKNDRFIKFGDANEIKIGNIFFNCSTNTNIPEEQRKKLTFHGGAVIDEVGLGKTIMALSASILNPKTDPKDVIQYDDCKYFSSKATLIIVPNHLAGQWPREIKKMISKNEDLNVITIKTKVDFEKLTYQDVINADFVIVTFNFFNNKSLTNRYYLTKNSMLSVNYHKAKNYNINQMKKLLSVLNKEFWYQNGEVNADKENSIVKLRFKKCPILPNIHWHRIIVDEFHEVNTNKKFNFLENIIPTLKSTYRWIVTATPFNDNASVYNCVRFLTKYDNIIEGIDINDPYGNKKMLSNNEIVEYLINHCFRRNTHKSTSKELVLPPYEEEVIWLRFSATERMMYNAYLANANNDKYGVYLRQLCCHPQIADETKYALSNCKTLEEIEKVMVSHYKNQYTISLKKVKKIKKRINSVRKEIAKFKKKQQQKKEKKNAKKLGLEYVSESESEEEESDTDNESITSIKEDKDEAVYDENVLDLMKDYEDDEMFANILGENEQFKTVENLEKYIKILVDRFKNAKKELAGKEATYNFYTNVMERIRKTAKVQLEEYESDEEDVENEKNELKFKNLNEDEDINDVSDDESNEESSDEESSDEEDEECAICLNEIPQDDIGVTKCGHMFCYQCLKTITMGAGVKCPTCMRPLKQEDVLMLNYEPPVKKKKATTEELSKQEMINEIGTKLANLIDILKKDEKHTIIFSQWDNLLLKVGNILKKNGIKNVFCKGNVFVQDKAIREFSSDDSIKVIMLSSKNAASGTNLTKAKRIILLDPVYGSYKFRKATENQAIGRAHRLGQTENIKVLRLIIKDTIENEIYKDNVQENKKFNDKIKVIEREIAN